MDVRKYIEGLYSAANAVEVLSATVSDLGGSKVSETVTKIAGVAKTVLEVVDNVQERVKEGTVVLTSENEAEIDAIIARLKAENDRLASAIAAS